MARSIKKGPFVDLHLTKKIDNAIQKNDKKVIKELVDQAVFGGPVVTELTELKVFYAAEDYHQKYYDKNPEQAYCQAVVAPKIAKFRAKYRNLYI